MKLKKWASLLASLGAFSTLSTSSISCSVNVLKNIQQQSLLRKQKLISRYNATKKDEPFAYNLSNSYGSYSSGEHSYIGGSLWRYKRSGETKVIDYIKSTKNEQKEWKSSSQLILRPTFEWFSLELIAEIIITKQDGSQIHYTNSTHELMPSKQEIAKWDELAAKGQHELVKKELMSKYNWDGNSVSLRIYSNDPKSINHRNFLSDMKGAAKISLVPRETYYSDYLGNKTKYQLKAHDFYYSWMDTQLYAFEFRMNNGGIKLKEGKSESDAIGERIKKIFNDPNIKMFASDRTYPNGYLFELFDVSLEDISNKQKTIQKVITSAKQEKEAFVFHEKTKGVGGKFNQLWFTLINDSTFSPLPYEYVIEHNDIDHYEGKLKLDELIKDKSSLAWELGYYWYGKSLDKALYIGPYIPKKYDEFTQKKIYFQNPNFFDQEWVREPRNIKVIQDEYKTSALQPVQFATEQLNAYKAGLIDSISFTDLPESVREELIAGIKGMPIEYSKSENKNRMMLNLVESTTPTPWSLDNLEVSEIEKEDPRVIKEIDKYHFNDQYSKIMYGVTRKQLSLNYKKPISTLSHILKRAKSFRTIFMNVANMYALVDYLSLGLASPLLPGMAPDAIFSSSINLIPRSKLDELNKVFVFDKDGNKHIFKDGSDAIYPDFSFTNKVGSLERLKSKYYEELQELMKSLLDEVYTQEGWAEQKIEWKQVYRYTNPDAKMKEMMRNFEKLVNGLDQRISFKFITPQDSVELRDAIISHRGVKYYSGWGYDYEGIGQYYTALSSVIPSSLIYILSAALQLEESGQYQIAKNLPHILKLAKKLDSFIVSNLDSDQLNGKIYLPYSLKHIANTQNYDVIHSNLDYSSTKLEQGVIKKLELTNEEDKKQLERLKAKGIENFKTQISKFFLYIQEEYSLQEHIDLINEINSVYGWDFGQQLQISKEYAKYIKNIKFSIPSGSSSISYIQDIVLKEEHEIIN